MTNVHASKSTQATSLNSQSVPLVQVPASTVAPQAQITASMVAPMVSNDQAQVPPTLPLQNTLDPLTLKLDHTNFAIWRSLVLSTVRALGLEGFLEGSHVCPDRFLPNLAGEGSSSGVLTI